MRPRWCNPVAGQPLTRAEMACLRARAALRAAVPLTAASGASTGPPRHGVESVPSGAPDQRERAVVVGTCARAQCPDEVRGACPEPRRDQPVRLAEQAVGA